MQRWAIVVALAASLGAVFVASQLAAAPRSSPAAEAATCRMARTPPSAPVGQTVHFGHARSLARKGASFELRFDPALWLSGATANRAAIEDGSISPGDTVPNDYYIRDESRRLLTYRVPASARATVIALRTGGLCSTRVPISELAQIVKGRNPQRRRLYVPGNRLGFWIRVAMDTIRALDQQYQP
jgi:hypothetical protein